jgi:hypothetical protein
MNLSRVIAATPRIHVALALMDARDAKTIIMRMIRSRRNKQISKKSETGHAVNANKES